MSAATMVKGVDRRAMSTLSAGHLFTDLNQGAVAALIPFLVSERGISLAAAGGLVLAATVSSSVIQPIFGVFSDRKPLPILMPLGVLFAGVGMALVGLVSSYILLFACIVVSGIGVAAFHPESARFANYVSGERRARGMSFFSVGGNAGFALGPALTTPFIVLFGLPGTLILIVPALAMAAILFYEMPRLVSFSPDPDAGDSGSAVAPDETSAAWSAFARLVGVVTLRSFVYFGIITFLASYYVENLGTSPAVGNVALTVMLASGAVGTLLLGGLADRFGRKVILAATLLVMGPLIFAFTFVGAVTGGAILVFVGAATIGTFGVTVVMGQEYLPKRIGLVSGITMGLSIGIGGIGAVVLGVIAEATSLTTVFLLIAVLPVLGFLVTLTLPNSGGGRAANAESDVRESAS